MEAVILALSHCNWHGFAKFAQDNDLPNPLQSISDSRLGPAVPASYPAALSFDGDGFGNLVHRHENFEHGSMTVLCKLDEQDTILRIATKRNMLATVIDLKAGILLVTASYSDWYRNILSKLQRADDDELAQFYTTICVLMESHGFRELFRQHPRTLDGKIFRFD